MSVSDATIAEVADLAAFIKTLTEEGRAVVSSRPLPPESAGVLQALRQCHESARAALALPVPDLSPATAVWAAELFYNLCRFLVCRDVGAEAVDAACQITVPEPRGPATDWSADLTLRHLPKLFQLARQFSPADPLVLQLRRIAAGWPLSSVGIPGLTDLHLDSFLAHPTLCRLYADRIMTAGDTSRLGHSHVDDLLRRDIGLHHELAPAMAIKLFPPSHDSH